MERLRTGLTFVTPPPMDSTCSNASARVGPGGTKLTIPPPSCPKITGNAPCLKPSHIDHIG